MNESGNLYIPLRFTPGAEGIYLRSLTGADEIAIDNTGTKNLIRLLNSLIQPATANKKVDAAKIVTSDRDRLLARLYIAMYGSKIESTVSCKECGEKYDLDFSLDKLLKHYQPSTTLQPEAGNYEIETGICFQLPNGEDELSINGFKGVEAERQLFERCLLEGNLETDNEKVQKKMEELAPVLCLDMQTICPECDRSQDVHFDMQSFFLAKLKQGRQGLLREIHNIASQYHWSHQEILDLPRDLRKQYAALIQPEI